MEFYSVNKLFQQSFVEHWNCPAVSDLQGEAFTFEDICNRIVEYHVDVVEITHPIVKRHFLLEDHTVTTS